MMHGASRAWPVVAAAAAAYAAFTLVALALHDWNPLWFVWIGERWANLDPGGRSGYDGQFVYYIARDGWAAVAHLDNAPYRLQRILYPAFALILSGGNPGALPWVMPAINAAAILATTLLLTRWLTARGVWRWYGLAYPFYVGNLMSYSRDLTEPLACGLAAAAVVTWLSDRRAVAIVLLAAAALARETTTLFVAALGIAELLRGRWRRVAVLAGALAPMLIWQLYLQKQFGVAPATYVSHLSAIPTTSIFAVLSLEPGRLSALLFLGLPTLAFTPVALRWLVQTPRDPITWLVAVHWAFTLLLPPHSNLHVLLTGRLLAGFLVALLFAFPRCTPPVRLAIAACAVIPTLIWFPVVLWWAPWTAKV
jgi:hypothetical protein